MPAIDEDELVALRQLDLAKTLCEPIKPDRYEGAGADTVGIVTAGQQRDVLAPILAEAEIVIEFRGSKLVAGGLDTFWGWRHKGWRSETTTIHVLVDTRDRSAAAATKSAHTTGRKIYAEQILDLRVARDDEMALCVAHDESRDAVRATTERLLRAFCRKTKQAESRVLEQLLDLVPGRERTFAMLTPMQVGWLYCGLRARTGDEFSVKFDAGASPKMDDDLPPGMGGSEVVNG